MIEPRLVFASLILVVAGVAQSQTSEEIRREVDRQMDRYRADGMMPSKRLSETQARAVLVDTSLARYEVGSTSAPLVAWPATAEVKEYYEVDSLVFPGESLLEATAPSRSPYAQPVEYYLLTQHQLASIPTVPGQTPSLGIYGDQKDWKQFKVAKTEGYKPVYLVTRWRAVEVGQKMTFPTPQEVARLARPKPVLPSVASALPVANQLWLSASSPETFLDRYNTISRYGDPNWKALADSGEIVGVCGVHAGVIEQLADQKGVPSLVLMYLPTHKDAEGHAYTALWDQKQSAWIHNPYPWEKSFIAPGPILGGSMQVCRPGTKLANHGNTRIVIPRASIR